MPHLGPRGRCARATLSPSETEPVTKVVAVAQAPATVQKPRRRSDLNLDAAPAPKRKRPEIGTDPDALSSRGFEFFNIKIIETKIPQTGKYSGNFAFCYNESGLEDLYITEERKRLLEVHMGGDSVTGYVHVASCFTYQTDILSLQTQVHLRGQRMHCEIQVLSRCSLSASNLLRCKGS